MRKLGLLAVVFFLIAPASVALAAGDTPAKELCKKGSTRKVSVPVFNEVGAREALGKLVGDRNLCVNDIIGLGSLGQLIDTKNCLCPTKEDMAKVGCDVEKKEVQPTVTILMSRSVSGCKKDDVTISKCVRDPKAAYKAACESGDFTAGLTQPSDDNVKIAATPWTANDLPNLGLTNESDLTARALSGTRMVSTDQAKQLSEHDLQSSQDFVRAFAAGDKEATKAAAGPLKINPDLITDQQMAQPPSERPLDTTGYQERDPAPTLRQGTGGFGDDDPNKVQCGIPGIAGRIMGPETGCGANTYNSRSDVRGPYQYLCGTWNTYARNTGEHSSNMCSCTSTGYYAGPCAAVEDKIIGGRVTNGQYAIYERQYGDQCSSAGIKWDTCAYAIHFAGESGFQRLLSAYQSNPNMPMTQSNVSAIFGPQAYAANYELFQRAGTAGGVFNYLEGGLNGRGVDIGGGNRSVPAGYSYNGAGSLNPYQSPFTIGGGQQFPNGLMTGSPFGAMNPLAMLLPLLSQNSAQNASRPSYQQQYPQTLQNSSLPQVLPIVSSTTVQTSGASTTIPNLTVIARPQTVAPQGMVTVSWASVGVDKNAPCVLSRASVEIARGFSGSKKVTVGGAGNEEYILTCLDAIGQKVTASDTIVVH